MENKSEPKITVVGALGGDRRVTREQFIEIWTDHSASLCHLSFQTADYEWAKGVVERTRIIAGEEFDRIAARDGVA